MDKRDDAKLQSTGLAVEGYHPPMVEKQNVIAPQKTDSFKQLLPAEYFKQEKHPDKTFKPKEVLMYERMTPQKYIINFGYNSYDLSVKSIPALEQIVELLVQHSKAGIVVKGYTDANGNNKYNKKLSKLRANFVKRYIVNQGIESSRIKILGMGETNPIASNNTEEGRRRNRRAEVEFNFYKT